MKKRLIMMVFFLLLFILPIWGCGDKAPAENESPHGEVNQVPGVEMTVKEGSERRTGLSLRMENTTEIAYITGSFYALERKEDGKWNEVLKTPSDTARGWTLVAYPIAPKGSREETIDWVWLYGELPPGEYRVIKEISEDKPESETFYLAAEFTIS